jgi:CRP-like cAMP-binding protein
VSLLPEKLRSIARAFSFERGARLVRQGELARGAFFIDAGSVAAEVAVPGGGMLAVAELGAGDMFGEMALIERGICSASVMAKSDVQGWFVEREDFRALVASRDADALDVQRAITRVLAAKLRALNAKVREHPAEEDRAPRGEPPARIDFTGAAEPHFDWRAFLPLLRFFEGFDREELRELVALGRAIALPRGSWLFGAGQAADSCLLVVRGAVEVLSRQGELERRVALGGPGELIGYLALLERAKHAASARVREQAALIVFPAAAFIAVYEGRSGMSVRLQRAIHGTLLRSLARTNGQLTRLISAARLRGADSEGRALEAARAAEMVNLVEQPH